MLFSQNSATEKRANLRKTLNSGKLMLMPGAHSPIAARIVEELGFDGVYISGAALSAEYHRTYLSASSRTAREGGKGTASEP